VDAVGVGVGDGGMAGDGCAGRGCLLEGTYVLVVDRELL